LNKLHKGEKKKEGGGIGEKKRKKKEGEESNRQTKKAQRTSNDTGGGKDGTEEKPGVSRGENLMRKQCQKKWGGPNSSKAAPRTKIRKK